MRLKIDEALQRCRDKGNKVFKKDVAKALFPEAEQSVREVKMTRLCKGDTARVDPAWIPILCKCLDCTPQFLLGMNE